MTQKGTKIAAFCRQFGKMVKYEYRKYDLVSDKTEYNGVFRIFFSFFYILAKYIQGGLFTKWHNVTENRTGITFFIVLLQTQNIEKISKKILEKIFPKISRSIFFKDREY